MSLDALLFHLLIGTAGANLRPVVFFVFDVIVNALILTALVCCLRRFEIVIPSRGLTLKVPFEKYGKRIYFISGGVTLCIFLFIIVRMDIPAFLKNKIEAPSGFYEDHYIDPRNVTFTVPPKKRNLLVIFVESLETGFLNTADGGVYDELLTPRVRALASDAKNINFSGTDGIGGDVQVYGTGWTMAGITAAYTGIPVIGLLNRNIGDMVSTIMPGVTALGDILKDTGYHNYWLCGSDGSFAGRQQFFETHGDTVIWDYVYFRNNGYVPSRYRVFWGFEDRKLYRFAKEKLAEIGVLEEPFFFTLLTVDTHFPDGYLDKTAERIYDTQYKNVLADMDSQLGDFIAWIQQQVWYENTTVVVLGDHLFMSPGIFPRTAETRYPLNIFINSPLRPEYAKNRQFTRFDLFPALLDAIGFEYDAPGLGLGRRLDRGEATLLESMGQAQLDALLQKKSVLYQRFYVGKE